ncbi:Sieve element occlusion [Trema orientale]|uniref:Sieve element occlusion n=1 Tax=Trema orientale TaxID=63057 RepID=A0A2P5ECS6_TREOI|nr:Sieve element occlusion [Trema orientale]
MASNIDPLTSFLSNTENGTNSVKSMYTASMITQNNAPSTGPLPFQTKPFIFSPSTNPIITTPSTPVTTSVPSFKPNGQAIYGINIDLTVANQTNFGSTVDPNTPVLPKPTPSPNPSDDTYTCGYPVEPITTVGPNDPNTCVNPINPITTDDPTNLSVCLFDPFHPSVKDHDIISIICPLHEPPTPAITFSCSPLFTVVKNVLTRSTQFIQVESSTEMTGSQGSTPVTETTATSVQSSTVQSVTQETTVSPVINFEWPSCLQPCLLKKIAVKMMSCNSQYDPIVAHQITESIFREISTYSWEAKAVLALGAFAMEFGHFSYLQYQIRQSITDIAFLKSLGTLRNMTSSVFTDSPYTQLIQIQKIIGMTMEVMDIYFQLTENSGPNIIATIQQTLPIKLELVCYWITLTVVACATQLNTLTCCPCELKLDYLEPYTVKIQSIHETLVAANRYSMFCNKLPDITDVVELLKAMFSTQNNESPLLACPAQDPVKFEDLSKNKVLLLISGLNIPGPDIDRIKTHYNIIEQGSTQAWKIVWVPIVDQCNSQVLEEFHAVRSKMQWWAIDAKIVAQTVGIRYIKDQQWDYDGKTTLVVLNERGQVENLDAFPLLSCVPPEAIVPGPIIDFKKEEEMLQQVWLKAVVANMGVDHYVKQMENTEKYTFFYGGTDQMIQEFVTIVTSLSSSAMTSAGISIEKHCVNEQSTQFWNGVQHIYMRAEYKKMVTLTTEIQRLLSCKNMEGWVLLCQGSRVVVVTHVTRMVHVLTGLISIHNQIQKTNFTQIIRHFYDEVIRNHGPPPCVFEIPCIGGGRKIEQKPCHDCPCGMRIRIIYECAHETFTTLVQNHRVIYSNTTTTSVDGYNQQVISDANSSMFKIPGFMNTPSTILQRNNIPGNMNASHVVASTKMMNNSSLVANHQGFFFDALMQFLSDALNKNDFELWCIIAWSLWMDYNKNIAVHGWYCENPELILEGATLWLEEFQRLRAREELENQETPVLKRWIPPRRGQLKMNVDAATTPALGFIGVGAVIRDEFGVIHGAFSRRIQGNFGAYLAECSALREGLSFAEKNGIVISTVETDSRNVVAAVRVHNYLALEIPILSDVCSLLFQLGNVSCIFISRQANNVAHNLARLALSTLVDISWFGKTPECLSKFVLDAIDDDIVTGC